MSPAHMMEIKTHHGKSGTTCCHGCKSEIKLLQARVVCLEKALDDIYELLKEKNGISNNGLSQDSRAEVVNSTNRASVSESSGQDTSDLSLKDGVSTATLSCKRKSQFEAGVTSSVNTSKFSINDGASESFIAEAPALSHKRKRQEADRSSSVEPCEISTNNGLSGNFMGTAILSCKRKNQKVGTPSSIDINLRNSTKNLASKSHMPSIGLLDDKLGIVISEVKSSNHNLYSDVPKNGVKNQPSKGDMPFGVLDDKLGTFIGEPGSSNINLYSDTQEKGVTSSQTDVNIVDSELQSSLGNQASSNLAAPLDLVNEVTSTPETNFLKDGHGRSLESISRKASDVQMSIKVEPGASLKHHSSVSEPNEENSNMFTSGSYPVILGEPVHINLKDFLTPVQKDPAELKSNDSPATIVKVKSEYTPMDIEEVNFTGESLEHYSASEPNEKCSNMSAADNYPVIVGEPVHINPKDFVTTVGNDPAALKSNGATVIPVEARNECMPVDRADEINCTGKNNLSFESSFCPIKEGKTEKLNDGSDKDSIGGDCTDQCADGNYTQTNMVYVKEEVLEEELSQTSMDGFSPVSCENVQTYLDPLDGTFKTAPFKAEEFSCTFCSAEFPSKSILEKHVLTHIKAEHPKEEEVSQNSEDSSSSFSFGDAEEEVSEEGASQTSFDSSSAFSCEDDETSGSDDSDETFRTASRKIEYLPCPLCSAHFTTKSTLERHLRNHSKKNEYSCTLCTAEFKLKSELYQHLASHSNEEPLSSRTTRKVKKHSANHFDDIRYTCAHCNIELKTKPGLRAHLEAHTKEEDLTCEHCGSVFKKKMDLQRHSLIARCWLLKS